MCDIYGAKCAVCGEVIPMHLGDYETKRDEITITCGKHIPHKNRILSNIMVWFIDYAEAIEALREHPRTDIEDIDVWAEQPIIYVEALTDNAWKNRLQNHPNIAWVYGVPLNKLGMFHYGLDMWVRGQYSMEAD